MVVELQSNSFCYKVFFFFFLSFALYVRLDEVQAFYEVFANNSVFRSELQFLHRVFDVFQCS